MKSSVLTGFVLLAWCTPAVAQTSGVVMVVPGRRYEMGSVGEFLLGSNWRDLWTSPVKVPVLDLGTFAGGIKPFRAGGNQSRTLRFLGQDGRVYIFRSIDKFLEQALPDDMRNTFVGDLIQDQTSSTFPSGALVVARLSAAVGLLHVVPRIVVMPDDPRLGEFRERYAGVLGYIEERPDEAGEDGVKETTFGAEALKGTEGMIEDLEEELEDRIDAREYLAARLIDFLIGDADRGADQWRWARFDRGHLDVYRPIPRDHDYAFMRSNGVLGAAVRAVFPKLLNYGPRFPSVNALTFMTQEFDRAVLVELTWRQWDSVTTAVRSRLSDEVIAEAVRALPPEHYREAGAYLERSLRARRDHLREVSRRYYVMVSREADVFASDEDDVAEIERRPDGSVEVRLYTAESKQMADGGAVPMFRRLFVPTETKEVRVFLLGGDDRAIVRGDVRQSIKVRVAGGAGNDILIDSARVRQGGDPATVFYDAHGQNLLVSGHHTRIETKTFVMAQPEREEDEEEEEPADSVRTDSILEERRGRYQDQMNDFGRDFLGGKTSSQPFRTWGMSTSWTPAVEYREGAGIVLGPGYSARRYSFRHAPYYWNLRASALYALGAGGFGVAGALSYYPENSKREFSVQLRATTFEANRFYGFGNDTPELDPELTLVMRDELRLEPALMIRFAPDRRLSFGPVLKYVNARPRPGSPADVLRPLASDNAFGQIGVQARGDIDRSTGGAVPHSGWRASLLADAYPDIWDADGAFGSMAAKAAAYIPIGAPVLAFRAGAEHVWGDFPLHEAAFLGGRYTLRGYRWNRFAGDGLVYGAAELRTPITRVELFVRGTLGATAMVDAGRVWFDGASDGGWHAGYGGGLWFASLNRAVSVTYAYGENGRLYFNYGMRF